MSDIISLKAATAKILMVRGKRVMLDNDLAKLYRVETKQLNRQVRRNIKRFPSDFMLRLTRKEYQEVLRCQFGTIEIGRYSKYLPFVFTEQGVAMLSSVLNSERAIMVNIQIMRAFAQFRRMLLTNRDLRRKIEAMEKKYDRQFVIVFEAIKRLLEPPEQTRTVGFHAR